MGAAEKGTQATRAAKEAINAVNESNVLGGYMPNITTEELVEDIDLTSRNFAALVAGLPGDIASIFPGAQYSALKTFPTSEEIAEAIGGDPSHGSWLPTALVAPGPGELKGAMAYGKALLNGIDPSLAMTLFHGTPHKFSKFELEKIGTGEGAQAYGHGLYFAESPGVAKSYQNSLGTGAEVFLDGKPFNGTGNIIKDTSLDMGRLHGRDAALAHFDKYGQNARGRKFIEDFDFSRFTTEPGSHLYEVDIPDDITAKMLDWDAPLSEQPESVRKALREVNPELFDEMVRQAKHNPQYPENFTGERFYNNLAGDVGGEVGPRQAEASRILNEAGIPGIRFLDGSSRGLGAKGVGEIKIMPKGDGYEAMILAAPDSQWGGVLKAKTFDTKDAAQAWADKEAYGTRNIVVFNPDDIKAVKRDGELVFKMIVNADVVDGFTVGLLAAKYDNPKPIPPFHKEMWEKCCESKPKLAIAAPRGHAKSTAITHAYILAMVLFRVKAFVLLVSDTEGQAVEFLGDIKAELTGNTTLRSTFGIKRILKDTETNVVGQFKDGEYFRIQAKGSEQKVRGLKWRGKRPDLIVGDDLENDEIV